MKQKKKGTGQNIAPGTPTPPVADNQIAEQTGNALKLYDRLMIVGFSILLLITMTIMTGPWSVTLAVVALVAAVLPGNRSFLGKHLSIPVLGLLFYAVMQGLSAVYSPFDTMAMAEFYKWMASISLVVILLSRYEKKHVAGLLWGALSVSALLAIISVDGAGFSALWHGFVDFTGLFGSHYEEVNQYTGSTRVAGIWNNANVSASIFGISSIFSLYLLGKEKTIGKKMAAGILLGINAMTFFLSMSRGAILCFALSLLVWLIAAGKGQRLALFIRMVISAVVVMILSVVAMQSIAAQTVLSVLLLPVTGVVITLLDQFITERLASVLNQRVKLLAISGGVLVAVVVVFIVVALQLTTSHTFGREATFTRILNLEPGYYTVESTVVGEDPMVHIYGRTSEQAMLGQVTNLYEGPLSEAELTVESEDIGDIYFDFTGKEGTVMEQVTLSNGKEIPLDYKLLPAFLVNRFQEGFFGGSSTPLRIQFMKDALKIWAMSPIYGMGQGANEGLLYQVQPFHYQSKYVHNQFLQIMEETGLLGLAGFLVFVLGIAWLLLRRVRKEQDPLAAALIAVWMMIISHSAMEINFSVRSYQCFAYMLLVLMAILYAEPVVKETKKWMSHAFAAFMGLYMLVFGGMVLSHRIVSNHAATYETNDIYEFLNQLETYVKWDPIANDEYRRRYVKYALQLNEYAYNITMFNYVNELRDTNTYENCTELMTSFYLPTQNFGAAFDASRTAVLNAASDPVAWNNHFDSYYESILPFGGVEFVQDVIEGTQALRDQLITYEQGRMEKITLTEENQEWIKTVDKVAQQSLSAEEAFEILLAKAHTLSDEVTVYEYN